MKTTWRFELTERDTRLSIPEGATLLHVGWQSSRMALSIWFRVDTEVAPVKRRFVVRATSDAVPPAAEHCGTVILDDGYTVCHVFEITP